MILFNQLCHKSLNNFTSTTQCLKSSVLRNKKKLFEFLPVSSLIGWQTRPTGNGTWAMTSWSLWNARNWFYFEHSQTHPTAILRGGHIRAGGIPATFCEPARLISSTSVLIPIILIFFVRFCLGLPATVFGCLNLLWTYDFLL